MNIFRKITEATLSIEKDIILKQQMEETKYEDIIDSLFDGVEKIFPNISRRYKDIITMRICDNLEKKGISFSF